MTSITTPTVRASRAIFALNIAAQTLNALVGFAFTLAPDDFLALVLLLAWCVLATTYAIVAISAIGRSSRLDSSTNWRPSRVQLSQPAHVLTYIFTVLTSLVGLTAAVQVLVFRSDPELGFVFNAVGVWAMLLAWGFLHWNFAQLYMQNYYRSDAPTLSFPGKTNPTIADFAYFSYTVGTSFAASDVEVQTTTARWGVMWHGIISFFFNSMIIVLAMNIITSLDLSGVS